jgi:catechol 2,3-dioxygenase-like lactoylglutathione lyase family enzyme
MGTFDIPELETMGPTIKALNVYVPAKDFDVSKRFYGELGFELVEAWGGTFDCTLGGATFRLQNYYVKDWADNFMMQLIVDDVRAWYEFAQPIVERGEFGTARIGEPEVIGDTTICHLIDPSGVLLIFIQ